jgi:hypothetical protein
MDVYVPELLQSRKFIFRADGALVPGAVGETRPLAMRLRSLEGATLLVEVS